MARNRQERLIEKSSKMGQVRQSRSTDRDGPSRLFGRREVIGTFAFTF